uniref:Uncharacterized protein n=1 Tax=Oryza sativa subsp. japonica TaxID=39947 RepID=Q69XY1_ORYSJ|nr:hypothetical protein [Oryza sativa Japonica Group]
MRGVYRGRGDRWPIIHTLASLESNRRSLGGGVGIGWPFGEQRKQPFGICSAAAFAAATARGVGFEISSGGWSCQPSGQVRATPTRQLGGVVAMTTDLVDRDETTTSPRSGNRDALEKAARLSCVHVAS